MQVRIYRPAKSAMQSGHGQSQSWVIVVEPQAKKRIDPLMGWVGSVDTDCQVQLTFDSREAAISYAERNGYLFTVIEPHERLIQIKSYADNFRVD